MSADGIFGKWQPRYAEVGISTFPVNAAIKKPAVRGYMKTGPNLSANWRDKFGDASAFGFACRRAGISVVDVDSTSESILADALAEYGDTPVKVRSGSNHFHLWYRNDPERRKVRPVKGTPIDILNDGFVIAPPSQGTKGSYEFLSGSLADFPELPLMRKQAPATPPSTDIAPTIGQADEPVSAGVGQRNDTLFKEALRAARDCSGLEALLEHVGHVNASFDPPLPHSEAVTVAHSAWRIQSEGKNRFGKEQRVEMKTSEIDALWDAPDAMPLLICLRRHHWERPRFFVANEMAKMMPSGGWHRVRFTAARAALEASGLLVMVERPRRTTPAVYRFGGL